MQVNCAMYKMFENDQVSTPKSSFVKRFSKEGNDFGI